MSNWNRSSNSGSNYSQNYNGPSTSNFIPFYPNYQDSYGQSFYLQANSQSQLNQVNNRVYGNQAYNNSGSYGTWYNPQFAQGYQQQEYIPSFVCQNSTYSDNNYSDDRSASTNLVQGTDESLPTLTEPNPNSAGRSSGSKLISSRGSKDGNSKNLPPDTSGSSSSGAQKTSVNGSNYGASQRSQHHGGSRKHESGSSNTGNNGGANRLYRNPNIYYGTTQHPHSPYRSGDNQDRGPSGSGGTDSSKTEDRKKLLAEVATLLNQDKRQVKAAITTRPDYNQNKNKNRGWAAAPNFRYQGKSSNKKEYRKNDSEYKRSDGRREPETQRQMLTEQLTRGKLECLVCCERLRQTVAIWSCQNCYHVLHLDCVSKWALTSTTKTEGIKIRQETSWRCPACQHNYDTIPDKYTCFCTKYVSPKWVKGETPHCCGEVCCKTRKSCLHPCILLCHPGPCPPCDATVQRECGCGRTCQTVKCSSTLSLECDLLCGKMLDCGKHDCLQKCHQGSCQPCDNKLTQVCFCGQENKEVSCGSSPQFSCGTVCGKELDCGKHNCSKLCHPGSCGGCPYDPVKVTTCHCGAKQIKRKCCTEPIESCGNKCSVLKATCTHDCTDICHAGQCPPCPVPVTSPCRCGQTASVQTTCHKLNTLGERPQCKKKCTKKRSCTKHKCNQECCNDTTHMCMLQCSRNLSCGQHRCQLLCHRGNCPPCTRLGFEEMRCHCGFSILYPPIDCGTRPPECQQPCTREHDCSHSPTHTCHSLPLCPPCTVLVSRTCYGGHETRKAIPCYIAEYSCGLPCGKTLPCLHRCIERCHGGPCPQDCQQACPLPRDLCSHPCALPCHSESPCTGQSPCGAPMEIFCQCGRRKQTTTCAEFRRTWAKQQLSAIAANKEQVVIDPSKLNVKVLDCDDECKLYERNLRLAIGLQIANPDLSNKLKPQYSITMKQWAKKDPRFCDMVHIKLTQLVQLAKESKQKSRSYSFDIMSAQKRQFVHEYCKHFGCESVAYDAEPKRNVVATAYRDKCWLPSYSLLEVIQRESGQRKVPVPVLRKQPLGEKSSAFSREQREAVQLPLSKSTPQKSQPNRPASPNIDYFDFPPSSST